MIPTEEQKIHICVCVKNLTFCNKLQWKPDGRNWETNIDSVDITVTSIGTMLFYENKEFLFDVAGKEVAELHNSLSENRKVQREANNKKVIDNLIAKLEAI